MGSDLAMDTRFQDEWERKHKKPEINVKDVLDAHIEILDNHQQIIELQGEVLDILIDMMEDLQKRVAVLENK